MSPIISTLVVLSLAALAVSTDCENTALKPLRTSPFQIIRPTTDHRSLELVEAGVERLARIKGQLAIVGVVGGYHSGKSFLLNALINMWRSELMRARTKSTASVNVLDKRCHFFTPKNNIFAVAEKVAPKTMGVWLLETDIVLDDGTKVLFMDTEGFKSQDVPESYDAKVFTVTTLLSSYLLYNSIKLVDQSEVETLEIMARRTQLFQIKNIIRSADEKEQKEEEKRHQVLQYNDFPPLTWVVEDFFQDLDSLTPSQWLNQYIDGRRDSDTEVKDTTLNDVFQRGIDCHTLFLPSIELDELENLGDVDLNSLTSKFIDDVRGLYRKVSKKVHVKQIEGEQMSGESLSILLRFILRYINLDSFPKVRSLWSAWISELGEHSSKEIEHFYNSRMSTFIETMPPRNCQEIKERHAFLSDQCEQLFKSMLLDSPRLYEPEMQRFAGLIDARHRARMKDNVQRVRQYIQDSVQQLRTHIRQTANEMIEVPSDPQRIKTVQEKQQFEWAQRRYSEKLSRYDESKIYEEQRKHLQQFIDEVYEEKLAENEEHLDKAHDEALRQCTVIYDKHTASAENKARTVEQVKNAHKDAAQVCVNAFKEHLQKVLSDEKQPIDWIQDTEAHKKSQHSLKEALKRKLDILIRKNDVLIEQTTQQFVKSALDEAREQYRVIKPFPDEEDKIRGKANDINLERTKAFVNALSPFIESNAYKNAFEKLKHGLQNVLKDTENKNVDAVKVESHQAQMCAERRLIRELERSSTFRIWFNWIWFRSRARNIAEDCFAISKESNKFSENLRNKVIDKWIVNDMSRHETNMYLCLIILSLLIIISSMLCNTTMDWAHRYIDRRRRLKQQYVMRKRQ